MRELHDLIRRIDALAQRVRRLELGKGEAPIAKSAREELAQDLGEIADASLRGTSPARLVQWIGDALEDARDLGDGEVSVASCSACGTSFGADSVTVCATCAQTWGGGR